MSMTTNMKKIPLAFGSTTIELEIPERNISSIILPLEPDIKKRCNFFDQKSARKSHKKQASS